MYTAKKYPYTNYIALYKLKIHAYIIYLREAAKEKLEAKRSKKNHSATRTRISGPSPCSYSMPTWKIEPRN